eukprot:CAMPEP_0184328694 /NCGR_PEP_ID=MMETSP1049-20130417/143757_1 /TAXON_ID=77928 /ORGANISM="Proteomonas sulcata, Strain CCMP704" /LENGTH=313 /DNA_ID=CAMNT_0026651019 /DNA_START=8 /DNA_END=949 /DNA_ORIENTATION=-
MQELSIGLDFHYMSAVSPECNANMPESPSTIAQSVKAKPKRTSKDLDGRSWSSVLGLDAEDRAVSFCMGRHHRLGRESPIYSLDDDTLSLIISLSEDRVKKSANTTRPSPGCSLYGFIFDVKCIGKHGCLVTAVQVYCSTSCVDPDPLRYAVYAANGHWRKKDNRHKPWSKNQIEGKWQEVADDEARLLPAEGTSSYQRAWLQLSHPVFIAPGATVSLYVHSRQMWGAVAYRLFFPAERGIETDRDGNLSFLNGTFTESSEPFQYLDGSVCAFAGELQYDILDADTADWAAANFDLEVDASATGSDESGEYYY